MHLLTLFQTTRPSFLILSPICVFLGTSTALAGQGAIDTNLLLLIVTGALCAHISVNTLNEYADFRSGLDQLTTKTPFSGGSGALVRDPAMANAVLAIGLVTLGATSTIGFYLAQSHGVLLITLGIIGVTIILSYTRWINQWPVLCLIAPGTGFGLLMVAGTHIVLTHHAPGIAWLAALVPFFLVNNLLLLNQYPDIKADSSIGRRHLPIAYGTRTSGFVYGVFALMAYLVILAGIAYDHFPGLSLIAIAPAALSLFALAGALRHGDRIGQHPQYLAANVAATLLTPGLLGIAILFG